jgi:SPP1 gp7 family putative phage head morphogenesis protein
MATAIKVENAKSWRSAARQGSRGREIYSALMEEMEGGVGDRVREIVRENARLISSIPNDVREMVNREISDREMKGLRPEAIAKFLRARVPQLTKNRVALIARTETSKSALALTQARSEGLGLEWGEWKTSEDARVRPSHRNLDKVLMRFDDPPNPEALIGEQSNLGRGLAGAFPNCRCNFLPLLNLSQIAWPVKVYRYGSIRRMTRGQFVKMAGMNAGFRA